MISVIIRDKPVSKPEREVSVETVQAVFQALLLNAQLERKLRDFRRSLREKRAKRRVRDFFMAWKDETSKSREKRLKELALKREKLTNETKIELFVNAIAEKKKQYLLAKTQDSDKASKKSRSPSIKRIQKAKVQVHETPAQSRLKAQKEIIEEQRKRLAEQSKYIEKLKRQELDKQAKKSSKETIAVAKEAINICNRQTTRNLVKVLKDKECR